MEATIGGQPIEDGRTYTGATNSYFAGFALKGIAQENTGRLRLDVVTEYLRAKGTVRPGLRRPARRHRPARPERGMIAKSNAASAAMSSALQSRPAAGTRTSVAATAPTAPPATSAA